MLRHFRFLGVVCLWLTAWFPPAFAEHGQQVYAFGTNGGANDGTNPNGGMVFDSAGDMYGTTGSGGTNCTAIELRCGTLFELIPVAGGGWAETVLYNFCAAGFPTCVDGAVPQSGLMMDAAGNIYGTTTAGGTGPCTGFEGSIDGCGTVWELSPSVNGWNYSVLFSFGGSTNGDGCGPGYATLAMDGGGNLYGTTANCNANGGGGIVFELMPPSIQGGDWIEVILYAFCPNGDCADGGSPLGGVALDRAGNLYGTTVGGGILKESGVLYQLSPNTDGSWTETVLYRFSPQKGGQSTSNVVIDSSGNIYGTLSSGGLKDCNGYCGGVFRFSLSTGEEASFLFDGKNGGNPFAGVVLNEGIVYGTTTYNAGNVFQIHGKTETVLYKSCSRFHCLDAGVPSPGAMTPNSSKLFGTTSSGGRYNQGVVFQLGQ
jgi:uncharacterized repeat protein (TIGR03803 family)